MKLEITHQERYSRGQLLLRTIFGMIYIDIPHGFLLCFVGIWSAILAFITFWAVLFTGRFPESIFDFQIKLMNWEMRFSAAMSHLVDGYPALGLNSTSDKVSLQHDRPEKVSRGLVILRLLLGWLYIGIPHGFCLLFRYIATGVLMFLAWWVVLFTGKYPERWHAFNVGSIRWATRIMLYMGYYTDQRPAFSGKAE